MTRQDATSILITFIVGFLAGGYFYVNGFTFKSSDTPREDAYTGMVIEGESYGNCQSTDGCLSFQLLGDGSYVVLPDAGSKKSKDGHIPASLSRELKGQLLMSELRKQTEKQTLESCSSDEGGIDYTFRVTVDDEEFVIDTCKTAVRYNSPTWLALAKLWNYFQTLK